MKLACFICAFSVVIEYIINYSDLDLVHPIDLPQPSVVAFVRDRYFPQLKFHLGIQCAAIEGEIESE